MYRVTKIIKKVKDYSYWEILEKLVFTTLLERKMRSDLIKAFKITKEISNYGRNFFNISPQTENLLSRQISLTKFTTQLEFFANRAFWNKLPNQIKNSYSEKKLDDLRKMVRKRI